MLGRLRRPDARLFLTSASLLFVELLLIRWIPATVVYVGFFNNFILMTSLLGIGAGILIGRRWRGSPALAPLLLVTLVVLVLVAEGEIREAPGAELFFGFSQRREIGPNAGVLALVVLLVTAVMAAIATPLAALLRSMPPLRAYAVDILGSLLGIALFAGLSVLETPPAVWFAVGGGLVVVSVADAPRGHLVLRGLALAELVLLVAVAGDRGERWSPYYRLDLVRFPEGVEAVKANGLFHQTMLPVGSPLREPYFEQVYRWFPERHFRRVLVVGAGTGNDTASALAHDVDAVDAVEIDPEIVRIGRARHPDRPYDDRRVTVHVDDGRAFLRNRADRYDLIVFAQTDSLTLVTRTANLRLESFLFTREAFAAAREHLEPDGLFVLYNWYRETWLVARYASMLEEAFGQPPLIRSYPQYGPVSAAFLVAGRPVAQLDRLPDGAYRLGRGAATPLPTTDDWPFPYLEAPSVPARYALALAFLAVVGLAAVAFALRVGVGGPASFSPHFFALGAAFLLLETRSLVTFSLLFGVTWVVNALVFFAILASVLAAVGVQARLRPKDPRPLYGLLFASLALAYALPPSALLLDPPLLRYALAAVVAFAPVFFANLVFAHSFKDTRAADAAFASNLLGAMAGGLLEWAALVAGYEALLVLVAALYALASLLAWRRVLGDRVLVGAVSGSRA